MKSVDTLLKYPGSKWSIADWIISHFPTHKVYVEPFFGSGAVFFSKPYTGLETINDINGEIVNLFKICRENGKELAAAVELTPYSRQEFYESVNSDSSDPIEKARKTIIKYWQCYGSSQECSKHSWKNSQSANAPNCAIRFAKIPQIIIKIAERLRMAQIENVDALTLIERYNDTDTLIYCDPPYLQNLRKRNLYKNEMSDIQHIELLNKLKDSNSKIIISAYDNELYNSVLQGWYTDTKITNTQLGKKRKEKLYMNFCPPLLYF